MLVSNNANEVKRKIIMLLKNNMKNFSDTKGKEFRDKINFYVMILTDDNDIKTKIARYLSSYQFNVSEKNLFKYIKHHKVCLEFFKGLELI